MLWITEKYNIENIFKCESIQKVETLAYLKILNEIMEEDGF